MVHVRLGIKTKFLGSTYCIILVGSRKVTDKVMANVSKFTEKKLVLKVNMAKSKISKLNDIKYLRFGF